MKVTVKTLDAKDAGTIELPQDIFGLTPRLDILHRVVVWQLAKRRAGTQSVKTRSEVARTKKKIYKQKGTGGARHASANAPIFRGGGVAHAPKPRSYEHALQKKVRALGLKMALSAKFVDHKLIVLEEARLSEPKTRMLRDHLAQLGLTNALIIAGSEVETNFGLAARNIPNLDVLPSAGLNVYDILRRDTLVITKTALADIAARFDKMRPAKTGASA